MPSTPASTELCQRQIADEIAGLGLCLPGSLVERTTRCGSLTQRRPLRRFHESNRPAPFAPACG
jgi:hypothetical protein